MRILLIASAYNSLTQRVHAELADRGHEVSVELALGDEVMRDGVRRYDPDLVIAPMLTTAIPADIWSARPCFIVHPGPRGDRGPSSLDWAIMEGAARWGVTVLQANAEMDAGDIWASVEFAMPGCSKSSAYRTEVADAAVAAVLLAVARFAGGRCRPEPLDYGRPDVTGRWRPPCRQADRRIDWPAEPTEAVLAKLRAADSSPGVLDEIGGTEYYLVGGHPEDELRGAPGTILARRDGAICLATSDGAVWIPQLRRRPAPGAPGTFKVPATLALRGRLHGVPEIPAPLTLPPGRRTYRQISYRESGAVGYLEFAFPGGAMSTGQCRRLLAAYRHAQARPVKVIVLGGPRDLFANGIHLNVIQAADDPAAESWRNINAIDDLVQAILTSTGQLTVAALAGNAAAGGLMLAAAADRVLVPGGRGPQPALPADGPARLGILDLHPAPPRGCQRGGPAHPGLPAGHSRLGAEVRPSRPRGRRRRGRLPRPGGGPGRTAGPQPGLPGAADRQGAAARGGREAASAGRLPCRRAGRHEPQLLRPGRAVRAPAPGLRLQGEAIAHAAPPRPAPDPALQPPALLSRAFPGPGRCGLASPQRLITGHTSPNPQGSDGMARLASDMHAAYGRWK